MDLFILTRMSLWPSRIETHDHKFGKIPWNYFFLNIKLNNSYNYYVKGLLTSKMWRKSFAIGDINILCES